MSTTGTAFDVAQDAANNSVSICTAVGVVQSKSPDTSSPSPQPAVSRGVTSAAAAAAAAAASQPRSGTLIPNRVFVGGIPSSTSEAELKEFFTAYGEVRDVKIIVDKSGLSKGYGFVTFESAEVAECIIQRDSLDGLVFRQRKLNIGPAIKKHPLYARPDPTSNGVFFTAGSVPYTYQNGMAVFHSVYQPQQLTSSGDLPYAQPAYSVATAAAAAAAVAAAAASGAPPGGQALPVGTQLMCLPAAPFTAVWPTASAQSPSPAQQSNTPSSAYYSAAYGPMPCYGSPIPRTPAMGATIAYSGVDGSFLSATSDYGSDPSYSEQSYASEHIDYDYNTVYHYQQQHPQQLTAAAFSPAYCYGSPPILCPVRAYPLLLNPHLATPPPPAPVARIANSAGSVSAAVSGYGTRRPVSADVCEGVDDMQLAIAAAAAQPMRLPMALAAANISHSS